MTMNRSPASRIVCAALLVMLSAFIPGKTAMAQPAPEAHRPFLAAPVWVYNNWSAYDELSDNVPLSEDLAMRQLDEILRLRKAGVRFDYYMMDAFWYDPEGGYRTWRAESWPEGPDRWIEACKAAGIEPGLWFSTNTLTHMKPAPQWRDSLDQGGYAMALYTGGFLADFMDVLQLWYDRGIRMFKLDFALFTVPAAGDQTMMTRREIRMRNAWALYNALRTFRRANPDAVLVGFNGIVGDITSVARPVTSFASNWLEVFDTLYSGDPRPADVPAMDFWRSMDIYSDHMVRAFERDGIPLSRVDSTSVMLGETGTNYRRGTNAWKGSLLLMASHGGWINTIHGNLDFLSDDDARWLAKVQEMYAPLQHHGRTRSFGSETLGSSAPYGFASEARDGTLYIAVNPSQRARDVEMPRPGSTPGGGRILFRDVGFEPVLAGDTIRLGPGQLALVGFGRYADAGYDLGLETDIRIPHSIERVPARFVATATLDDAGAEVAPANAGPVRRRPLAIEAEIGPPSSGDLRIILRRRDTEGSMARRFSKSPMGRHLVIAASQDGRPLPVEIRYDKVIWSGLSWAVGEIRAGDIAPGRPVRLRLSSAERDPSLRLDGRVYRVEY